MLTIYIKSMIGLQSSLSCCAIMKKENKYARHKIIRKEFDCVTIFCNLVILLNFRKTLALELNYKIKTHLFKEGFSVFCGKNKAQIL